MPRDPDAQARGRTRQRRYVVQNPRATTPRDLPARCATRGVSRDQNPVLMINRQTPVHRGADQQLDVRPPSILPGTQASAPERGARDVTRFGPPTPMSTPKPARIPTHSVRDGHCRLVTEDSVAACGERETAASPEAPVAHTATLTDDRSSGRAASGEGRASASRASAGESGRVPILRACRSTTSRARPVASSSRPLWRWPRFHPARPAPTRARDACSHRSRPPPRPDCAAPTRGARTTCATRATSGCARGSRSSARHDGSPAPRDEIRRAARSVTAGTGWGGLDLPSS